MYLLGRAPNGRNKRAGSGGNNRLELVRAPSFGRVAFDLVLVTLLTTLLLGIALAQLTILSRVQP